MSKVIDHKTVWYQEIASRDYYLETDLERTIMLYLEVIFPDFKVFPFKQDLVNNLTGSSSAADLGMVKNDYSEWYVIEVELGKHSKKDVIEQIEAFRNFTPSTVHSDYIIDKRPGIFNRTKLANLIVNKSPELMVIVDVNKDDWKKDLKRLSCKMCVFQIYSDLNGNRMYRLDGEHPIVSADFSPCKYEKTLPFTVKVLTRDFLDKYNIKDGDVFSIEYNGVNYLWQRQNAGSDVFLVCNNRVSPLDPLSSRYRLNYLTSFNKTPSKWYRPILKVLIKSKLVKPTNTFSFVKD